MGQDSSNGVTHGGLEELVDVLMYTTGNLWSVSGLYSCYEGISLMADNATDDAIPYLIFTAISGVVAAMCYREIG